MAEYKTKEQQKKFYNTKSWNGKNGLRMQALKRDNFECQMCKKDGKVHLDSIKEKGKRKSIELNVHHIKEIEYHPNLALVLSNLITICIQHHNEIHDRYKPSETFVREEKW